MYHRVAAVWGKIDAEYTADPGWMRRASDLLEF